MRLLEHDLDDLRQSINVWMTSIIYDIVCREKANTALLAAAKRALDAMHAVDCDGKLDDFNIPSFFDAQDSLQAAIARAEEPAS